MRGVSNFGAAQQRAFDAVYPGVAKAAGVRLYPFILDGVAGDPRLMQGDGIHPNAAGARLVGAKLAAFVAKAFALKRTPG
jgi:acyl-CoA thioesterase-1